MNSVGLATLEYQYLNDCVIPTHNLLRNIRGGYDSKMIDNGEACIEITQIVEAMYDLGFQIDWDESQPSKGVFPNYQNLATPFIGNLKPLMEKYCQFPGVSSTNLNLPKDYLLYIIPQSVAYFRTLQLHSDREAAGYLREYLRINSKFTPLGVEELRTPATLILSPLSTDYLLFKFFQEAIKLLGYDGCSVEPALIDSNKIRCYVPTPSLDPSIVKVFIDATANIKTSKSYGVIADCASQNYGSRFVDLRR